MARLFDITNTNTKILVMYNRLFTGDFAQKLERYHIKNIGESTSIIENGRSEPFDNKLFAYYFGDDKWQE